MSYVWCIMDGWGYRFNVIDVYTGQWPAFILSGRATRHDTIMVANNAVAARPGSTLRVDNGARYARYDFRSSAAALGITPERICVNTPEQNGHIESFHKTLKIWCAWPQESADINEAQEAPGAAFKDYNQYRIHYILKYLTPSEFAERYGQDSGNRIWREAMLAKSVSMNGVRS